MKSFFPSRWADLICFNGDDIGGVAVEREEFYFVGFAIFIDMDNRAHVAGHKSVRRERRGQNDSIVLFDHTHLSRYAGYAVTSRGRFRPRSIIQTVLTSGAFPDGVSIAAWRTYFTPCDVFQVLNYFTVQGHAAEGIGERFAVVQAEAERFKEFGLAVVVRMRGVEQVVREFFPLNQNLVCTWEFHATEV